MIFVHIAGLEKMWNNFSKKIILLVFTLLAILFFASCLSIPAGEVPDGELVNIDVSKDNLSREEAINYFSTSLTTYFLGDATTNSSIELVGDDINFLNKVFFEMNILLQFRLDAINSKYILRYDKKGKIITMQLLLREIKENKLLWQDSIGIK